MLFEWCKWLEGLGLSTTVRESTWVFPALECIHMYSMILLISILAVFDLRLLGFSLGEQGRRPLAELWKPILQWAWICFIINFATGALLFSSEATKMYINAAFRVKLLLVAGALVYHSIVLPAARRWDGAVRMPLAAKLTGTFSLVLWVGVIAASRWIAFVLPT